MDLTTRTGDRLTTKLTALLYIESKTTRIQVTRGLQFCYFLTIQVRTESKNDSTCTYQNQRHFCGYFKTQGKDLSSIISLCFQLNLHQTLVQRKMSFLLTLSNKTWYRVTRISAWNPIRMTKSLLKIATSLTIILDSSEWLYTAVSTKVVPEKCKSVRDKVDWLCLIAVQGDSATRNEKEGIHVFVLFPSTMLKHLEVYSSTGGPDVVCDLHTWLYCVTFSAI